MRVVVVRVDHGDCDLGVFFRTDLSMSVPEILETYADRWATEVGFRDLKQEFGFADSQARKRAAVERTAPFVGFAYTALVLWFADTAHASPLAALRRVPGIATSRDTALPTSFAAPGGSCPISMFLIRSAASRSCAKRPDHVRGRA
ncbi:MAG: hypothetical protein H0T76_06830 [Nannocystis sp.]|nr:hypothetical protein [Nannocystis sp.]MBA3546177.1 hypothetical protein [Nannocystis sp.]